MEKLIYALWRKSGEDAETLNARLLGPVADALSPLVKGMRINVQDSKVAGGTSPRFVVTEPQMDAVVQVWVDTTWSEARSPIEQCLADASGRMEGWLVAESTPIPNTQHPPQAGQRTEGFSQVVFLTKPSHLEYDEWRVAWQEGHTQTAIETQSNFEYIQNLVVRPLTPSALPFTAVVEECFPIAALNDEELFFDAVGNPQKLAANSTQMMDSCARFMGPEGADCIPTSQFDLKRPFTT